MRHAILFGAIAGAILLGCGALLDLDPLSFDEPRDASPGDGATAEGGPAEDAPSTADVVDASPPDGAQHCSDGLVHDFCDDFEGTRSSVQGSWTNVSLNGATLGIDGGVLVAAPPPDAGTGAAFLTYGATPWPDLPSTAKPKVSYRFRVKVDECRLSGPFGSAIAKVILDSPSGCAGGVLVSLLPQGSECIAQLLENWCPDGVYNQATSSTRIVLRGQWQDYELEISERTPGTAGKARLTIDADIIDFPLTFAHVAPDFTCQLGVWNIGPTNTVPGVLLDGIRVDYLR